MNIRSSEISAESGYAPTTTIHKRKEKLIVIDNPASYLLRLKKGTVLEYTLSAKGQEAFVSCYDPASQDTDVWLGLSAWSTESFPTEFITTTTVVVEKWPKGKLQNRLTEDPTFRIEFLKSLIQTLASREKRYSNLKSRYGDPVRSTASALLELNTPSHNGRLPLNQSAIAAYAGGSRIAINRALSSLRDAGLVRVEGRETTIIDTERLKEQAFPD